MKLYQVAFRNVLRNKRRSILSGIAIAISTLVIVFFYGFVGGMMQDIKTNTFEYVSGHVKVVNKDYEKNASSFPLNLGVEKYGDVLEKVAKLPDVTAAAPRVMFGTLIFGSPRIAKSDINEYGRFIDMLKKKYNPVGAFLMEKLPESMASKIATATDQMYSDAGFITDFLDAINDELRRYNLYEQELFNDVVLSDEMKSMLSKPSVNQDTALVNRLLLEEVFPTLVEQSPRLGKTFGSLGYGVDFEREKKFMAPDKYLTQGAVPSPGSNGILLSSGLAASMRLSVGDKLTLFTKTRYSGSNAGTFRVTGIVHFPVFVFNQKSFFLPIDSASDLLQLGDSATEILVLTKNEDNTTAAASGIASILKEENLADVTVERWEESGYVFGYIQLINISFLFVSLFFFLLGTTVIINTTMMVIYERIREIGTIAAMGMTGGEIVRLFFIEALTISSIAAFAGVVLGLVAVNVLGVTGLNLEVLGRGIDMEISTMIYPHIDAWTPVFVYIYAVAVSSLVSLIPSRHASKIEPVEALRSI